MDVLELYRRAAGEFGDRVHLVGDQWGNPSACSEWDVRTLVNHLVNEQVWVVPLMAGATVAEVQAHPLGCVPFDAITHRQRTLRGFFLHFVR